MRKLSMDELNRKSLSEFSESDKFPVAVILENIRSAYNVGSVFRTGDAFLINEIIVTGYSPAPTNHKVAKTSLGSEFSVDWEQFRTSAEAIRHLKGKGYFIVGVEQTNESVGLQNLKDYTNRPIAFIFGNEVTGVELETLKLCDECIEIPQFGTKHSLNISVAAGMVLWEAVKNYPLFEKQ